MTDKHLRRATSGPPTLAPTEAGRPDPGHVRTPGIASDRRFWTYFRLSATCAALVPVVVVGIARLTEDGPVRMLLTWAIALLVGLAVYTAAAATNAIGRTR